ncbi:MAG TPA: hypothetical protein VLM37_08845 [Fibrobacteraceae bacterium]|nr:hypothetical protein [Fibrobacteraceae bacterium]
MILLIYFQYDSANPGALSDVRNAESATSTASVSAENSAETP